MTFVYDPEDERTQQDPYPAYRRLRDEHPVYRQERLGFWALSRFDDVFVALRDHDVFCSSRGLTWDPRSAEQAGILPMMVTTDPPDHTKLRKLINRGFTIHVALHHILASVQGNFAGTAAHVTKIGIGHFTGTIHDASHYSNLYTF